MRLLVAFALLFAGCAGSVVDPVLFDPLWSERALPFHEGHDHADPLHHLGLSTPNFRVLGHDALHSDFYGKPPGATFCADAKQMPDGRRIAAAESRSKVGFTLVDVTDPMDPKWLGELVMENTRVYDVAVVPDGRHVVLVTQALQNLPAVRPIWTGPCGRVVVEDSRVEAGSPDARTEPRAEDVAEVPDLDGNVPIFAPIPSESSHIAVDPIPRPSSILLVDISDPRQPRITDHQPLYGYGHGAFSEIIDGRTWVLATTTGPATQATAYESTSAFQFYDIRDTPAGPRLHLLSIYKPMQDVRNLGPPIAVGPRGHDAWIAKHPNGSTLAYLAAWERLEIVDLKDPARPTVVGTWTDRPGRDGYGGAIHSVLPVEHGGRHYTIIGPEWKTHPTDHPSGIVWVLDTTDPAQPGAVGGWTLPHDVEWTGEYMFSNHYYGVVGSTMFVSMYHGGVWAVDLAPAFAGLGFANLPSIGAFLPVAPGVDVVDKSRWAPTLQEVLAFPDGVLVTFDGHSGVWTFTFDATFPAPAPKPWPITPP